MSFISKLHAEHLAIGFKTAQDRHWDAERRIRELEQQLKDLRSTERVRGDAYKAAHDAFARAFEPIMEGESVIDGNSHRFPHCDSYVLHAPGACRYCDAYPERQAKRVELGVAFTGVAPTEDQIPCPSEMLRPASVIHRWPGNRPTED